MNTVDHLVVVEALTAGVVVTCCETVDNLVVVVALTAGIVVTCECSW